MSAKDSSEVLQSECGHADMPVVVSKSQSLLNGTTVIVSGECCKIHVHMAIHISLSEPTDEMFEEGFGWAPASGHHLPSEVGRVLFRELFV